MSNANWMLQNCKLSCNVCEDEVDGEAENETGSEGDNEPSKDVEQPISESDKPECKDLTDDCHETSESGECQLTKCEFWAGEGECENNSSYMLENCLKACGVCETLFL